MMMMMILDPAVDLDKLPVLSIIDSNSRIVSFAPTAEVTITIPPPKVDMPGKGFLNKDYLVVWYPVIYLRQQRHTIVSL